MGGDVQSLGLELLNLISLFRDDNCHLHSLHIIQGLLYFFLLLTSSDVSQLDEALLFLQPVPLNLVIHTDSSELVYAHHHSLTFEASVDEVLDNILCHHFKPLIPLNDLKDSGPRVFQGLLFCIIETFILHQSLHISLKLCIGQINSGDSPGVE